MISLLKKLICLSMTLIILSSLSACQSKSQFQVGTTPGLYSELLRLAQNTLLAKYDLTLHIIVKPYPELNKMLANGKLDANFYQTSQALQLYNKVTKPGLANIGETYITPMALYSTQRNTLSEFKAKDSILVPKDPIEQSVALLLLKNAGVIGLKPAPHLIYSLAQIIPLISPQVRISAVDLTQITHKQAIAQAGILLYPYQALRLGFNEKQRLFEDPRTIAHAIVLAAKINSRKHDQLLKLLKAIRSKTTQDMIVALLHYRLANAF